MQQEFGFAARLAAELEFNLHGAGDAPVEEPLFVALEEAGLAPYCVDTEEAQDQFEVALRPASPERCVQQCKDLKHAINRFAVARKFKPGFMAKPFADQPGNGLHIHIDLLDNTGASVFFKQNERISDALKYSISGLLHWMLPSMMVFAPTEASYARFQAKNNAPTTVSWGANNRTVALRLPDAMNGKRHIEHRVAGSDANPERVIHAIMAAILDGLRNQYPLPEQIYGDAALAQYQLPPFPKSLKEAVAMQELSLAMIAS